jgi:hypothetical protein
MNNFSWRRALMLVALALSSCSPPGSPSGDIAGKVDLDGKPFAGVNVNFEAPELGIGAFASTDSAGAFKLKDSLPPGRYAVYLTLPVPMPPTPGVTAPPAASAPIPSRYQLKESSGLVAEVKAGSNTIDFQLQADR